MNNERVTRVIEGVERVGTQQQLDLYEEYRVLWAGSTVKFETDPGKVRVGLVTGFWMAGPSTNGWILGLEIKYRGGSYPRRASTCDLA